MNSKTLLVTFLVLGLAGLNVFQFAASRRADAEAPPVPEPPEHVMKRPKKPLEPGVPADLYERWRKRPYVQDGRGFDRTWFGINTLQHPYDIWTTQEIIFEVVPDVIVETGTYKGGSAALWAAILEHANPNGQIISIDIDDVHEGALALPVVQRRVTFLTGSSTDPEIVARVAQLVQGKKVLVILDSLHEKDHVAGELRAYAPMVSIGSYVIVQDTHLGDTVPFWWYEKERQWTPGPLEAVNEFVAKNRRFEIDHSREGWASTNNLHGWLKRVR